MHTHRQTYTPLGIESEHHSLHLQRNHNGPSEICSLFLHPDYRRGGLGRLLSFSRFGLIKAFPRCPSKRRLISINPSSGDTVWSGPIADEAAIGATVARARKAQWDWSQTSLPGRASVLRAFAAGLEARRDGLAGLIAREIGKPLWEAQTEVSAMIGKIDLSIRAHSERCADLQRANAITRFRPHGLVVVLGPYNFPGHLPNGHICPALLAGNAVIFKPSEHAPAVGEALAACWQAAGLPVGLLELVQGDGQTAAALLRQPGIDGVFFTGSARTGQSIAQQFASRPGTILALEMGGNNPLIADAAAIGDLDAAVQIILQSSFLSAGQRCTCARRLIVIDGEPASRLLTDLAESAAALRIDDPFAQPPPFMGPLAHPRFVHPVLDFQADLLRRGGIALLTAAARRPGSGFISPGIIDVTDVSARADAEVFGPLLQVVRVPDLDAAITEANATRFGLAAGLLSDDHSRYAYALPRLRAGIINWNQPLTGASSAAPFGGIGDSGNHRPSAYFAADYCSYPVASIEQAACRPPVQLPPPIPSL